MGSVTQQVELILSSSKVLGVPWPGMMMTKIKHLVCFRYCPKRKALNLGLRIQGPVNLDGKKYIYIYLLSLTSNENLPFPFLWIEVLAVSVAFSPIGITDIFISNCSYCKYLKILSILITISKS